MIQRVPSVLLCIEALTPTHKAKLIILTAKHYKLLEKTGNLNQGG